VVFTSTKENPQQNIHLLGDAFSPGFSLKVRAFPSHTARAAPGFSSNPYRNFCAPALQEFMLSAISCNHLDNSA